MIWRSPCTWHDGQAATVEVEFRDVPGPIALRVMQYDGRDCNGRPVPFIAFNAQGWAFWTSRNEIRCNSEFGPVVGKLDLERRAVRMRHFPYQITIPDRWHTLEGEL